MAGSSLPSFQMMSFIFVSILLHYLIAPSRGHYTSLDSHRESRTFHDDLYSALGLGGHRRTLGFIPGSGIGFKWLLSFPMTTITRLKVNFELAHDVPMRFAMLYPEIGDKQLLNPVGRMGLAEGHYFDEGLDSQLETLGYGGLKRMGQLTSDLHRRNLTVEQEKEHAFDNALKNDKLRSRIERMFFYTDFESLLKKMGLPGKPCMQRTICEIGAEPFEGNIFGELVNILLTPSLGGRPEYSEENQGFHDYIDAETYGKSSGDCAAKYNECADSVFSLIHDIAEDLFT